MPEISDEMLHRFDRAVGDFGATRDDVIALKQGYGQLTGAVTSLQAAIDRLSARFEEGKRTNWPLIAVLAGMLPVLLAGSGFIMSSYTTTAAAPLSASITELHTQQGVTDTNIRDLADEQRAFDRQLIGLNQQTSQNAASLKAATDAVSLLQQRTATSLEADSQSRTDRGQLNERVAKLETALATETGDRRSQAASFGTHLGEIETQFHAVSDAENLRAAQQERMNALLWQKTYGQNYPSNAFFPPSMFQPDGDLK